jgi:pyruvate kinase
MVARGDLGLDVPLEEVPHIQKDLIRQARAASIPVIVATQMLESMVAHVRPTRAEISDVCTAILDGADAIMLSAETASGRDPVEAVEVMARTAIRAEQAFFARGARAREKAEVRAQEAISDAAAAVARRLKARAIVAFTQSGFSARLISQERPDVPIIALTPFVEVERRLALCWGVSSRLIARVTSTEELMEEVERSLLADGSVAAGDILVIISGSPMWVAGTTNLLKVHRVGERR